jgi:hypothetical protein
MTEGPDILAPAAYQDAPINADVVPTVRVFAWTDWPRVAPRWSAIGANSPYLTFFVDAPWTENWLSIFGAVLKPEILIFEHDGKDVGCCLLVHRKERHGPLLVRRVYLNASGEDEHEEAGMEFNDLLCAPEWEKPVARALSAHLAGRGWDELDLQGCRRSAAIDALRQTFGMFPQTCRSVPSYYVNLQELRDQGITYETMLPYKSRYNIRQSVKLYREQGDFRVEVAHDAGTAVAMLEQLAELHQRRWTARGELGAFSSQRYMEFHRILIRNLFPTGAIQFIRTAIGAEPLGIAYNFVLNGKVFYYQCGSVFNEDKRSRPGVVTLYYAIQHSFDQGLAEYDMMAGDVQYKKTMSRHSRDLDWIVIRRNNVKMRLLEYLRSIKHFYSKTAGKQ